MAIERYEKNIGTTDEGEPIIRVYEWEACDECGERISDDDAIIHYHPGAVTMTRHPHYIEYLKGE